MKLSNVTVVRKLRASSTKLGNSATGATRISSNFRFIPAKQEKWLLNDEGEAIPSGKFVFSKGFVKAQNLDSNKGLIVLNDGEGNMGFGVCADTHAELFKTPKASKNGEVAKKSSFFILKGLLADFIAVGLITQFEKPTHFKLSLVASDIELGGIECSKVFEVNPYLSTEATPLSTISENEIFLESEEEFEEEDENESESYN